jgi:hypothetical protein
VLEKKSEGKDKQNSDSEVSNFVSRAEFQNITYWNHDTTPSAEDSLPRCFHWLTVASAVSIISSFKIYQSVYCPLDMHYGICIGHQN